MKKTKSSRQAEFGDWQTPLSLATEVIDLVWRRGFRPSAVVEPTCGTGSFICAAGRQFPQAHILGFDVDPNHVAAARKHQIESKANISTADFFEVDWKSVIAGLPEPILAVGNPPWVTNADLGALLSRNLPAKLNLKKLSGLDAMTGKSNFDVSEWMIIRLIEALLGRDFLLAMLCKASVARQIVAFSAMKNWLIHGSIHRIDAMKSFGASVEAVLLLVVPKNGGDIANASEWPIYDDLNNEFASRVLGVIDGRLCSDLKGFDRTLSLEGQSSRVWRSGIKHDAAQIMELRLEGDDLVNGLGEHIDIEPDYVYPLLKGSDIANGREAGSRFLIVPQTAVGNDTNPIQFAAPRTWSYLESHRAKFEARRSSIYVGQPPYSIFGIGPYSFASFKVAICGLYKRLKFTVVEPQDGRPVMVDDTCYFVPCKDLDEANAIADALNSQRVSEFFEARVFWEDKRPINKSLLQTLSLDRVLHLENAGRGPLESGGDQQVFEV